MTEDFTQSVLLEAKQRHSSSLNVCSATSYRVVIDCSAAEIIAFNHIYVIMKQSIPLYIHRVVSIENGDLLTMERQITMLLTYLTLASLIKYHHMQLLSE